MVCNDTIIVVELQVVEAELDCVHVGLSLGIFAISQTEKKGNMYQVGSALVDLAVGFGCFCRYHDEAKGGSLLLLVRGVLVSEVPEHVCEALIDIS